MELDERKIVAIRDILKQFLSNVDYDAFIFGSWATGNARENSDIDVGIKVKNGNLSPAVLENLKTAFTESDLAHYVDIVDFDAVSEDFKKVSLTKIIPL